MKKFYQLAIAALVGIALNSCGLLGGGGSGSNEPTFRLSDLQQGLWQEDNTEHFVRFTDEQSDETGYLLGREWNEDEWEDPDMTAEEFLIWNRKELGHPGNGWFKYEFKTTNGQLTEIHLSDMNSHETPKVYVVTTLSSTTLKYYEKGNENWKFSFTKFVEPK